MLPSEAPERNPTDDPEGLVSATIGSVDAQARLDGLAYQGGNRGAALSRPGSQLGELVLGELNVRSDHDASMPAFTAIVLARTAS